MLSTWRPRLGVKANPRDQRLTPGAVPTFELQVLTVGPKGVGQLLPCSRELLRDYPSDEFATALHRWCIRPGVGVRSLMTSRSSPLIGPPPPSHSGDGALRPT